MRRPAKTQKWLLSIEDMAEAKLVLTDALIAESLRAARRRRRQRAKRASGNAEQTHRAIAQLTTGRTRAVQIVFGRPALNAARPSMRGD